MSGLVEAELSYHIEDEPTRVRLSGNPFVDTGLAVIAALVPPDGLESVGELTVTHLRTVLGTGDWLARANGTLKSFTMIFTVNSLLTNPSLKPPELRKQAYTAILLKLAETIGADDLDRRCVACGAARSVDFTHLCAQALKGVDGINDQPRIIGRDWFPLAGSLGSDAQAYPTGSVVPTLCATCILAVHFLPLGVILLDGRLALFQSVEPDLWYPIVRSVTGEVRGRLEAGSSETLGAKQGSVETLRRLLSLFEQMKRSSRTYSLPPAVSMNIMRFSNAGANPDCAIDEIPKPALRFLKAAAEQGLRTEIEGLVSHERQTRANLYQALREGNDYFPLYPSSAGKGGATPELYSLYQRQVLGIPARSLELAALVANRAAAGMALDALARLRADGLRTRTARSRVRRAIVELAGDGNLDYGGYLALFPIDETAAGVRARPTGWNLLRFYLAHPEATFGEPSPESDRPLRASMEQRVRAYAGAIFDAYVSERGVARFRGEVLDRMDRGGIGVQWLGRQFARLAESEAGFSGAQWVALCCNEAGEPQVDELLFQFRILWKRMASGKEAERIAFPDTADGFPNLPLTVARRVADEVEHVIATRGVARFSGDVLTRLRRGEIGLDWFREHLLNPGVTDALPLTEEDWDRFVIDEDGQSLRADRLFNLHLLAACLYRAHLTQEGG
jgi:hypothetical protein